MYIENQINKHKIGKYNLLVYKYVYNTIDLAFTMPYKFAVLAYGCEHGVGQYGRKWISPAGNMLLSICEEEKFDLDILCDASIETLKKYSQELFQRKYPNDIYYRKMKIGGTIIHSKGKKHILSVGINLNSAPTYSISLSDIMNCEIDIQNFSIKWMEIYNNFITQ